MKFLVMTDIEGVTGVTTFEQAERSEFGRQMLMNDVQAVLRGIKLAGGDAILYDMHTDGRNLDLAQLDVPVVMGKPILGSYWRGVGDDAGIDGLFMVGLHTMQHVPGALMAHSYLREYDAIYLNGFKLGEIGMEAALAGARGIPLKFVSGDDLGCREATELDPNITTCAVKKSLTGDTAVCTPPSITSELLTRAAAEAAVKAVKPFVVEGPYEIKIIFSDCDYLRTMKTLHPEIFVDDRTVIMRGDDLLATWSEYLLYEKEMVNACL